MIAKPQHRDGPDESGLPAAPGSTPARGEAVPDVEEILDPEAILARCDRSADLGARTLRLFADSLPAELAALESAAAAGDVEGLMRLAHRMRGAAATLAATRLAGALKALELFLAHGDGGPLPGLMADVHHEGALLLGAVPHTLRRLAEE